MQLIAMEAKTILLAMRQAIGMFFLIKMMEPIV
jgi:hypothetical protein